MSKHKRYPARIPKYAAGIRAQFVRASLLRTWWAREWDDRLEGMGVLGRLGRGRSYALSGQVTDIAFEGSRITARVQGSRSDCYSVSLDFRHPEGDARSRIVAALKAEPMLVARMLADDFPLEMQTIFADEGFDLFPGGKLGPGKYDMTCDCSCPDYVNPCKHVMAVLTILGEEIARRPFALLEMRGIRMEELL